MFDSVFSILALFTIVVFIHELGHFLVARYCGVAVEVFSVGFGKELFGFNDKQGTRWRFSLIPLGGYIKMRGDENAASMPSAGARHIEGSFENARLGAKIAIIAAGPIANFLLAILVLWGLFLRGEVGVVPEIAEVAPDSLAARAGLQSGQEIRAIDERETPTVAAVNFALLERLGDSGVVTFAATYPGSDVLHHYEAPIEQWLKGAEQPNLLSALGVTIKTPPVRPRVGTLTEVGSARAAGFEVGDLILEADDQSLALWMDWVTFVRARPDQPITVLIERGGQRQTLTVTPASVMSEGAAVGSVGMSVALPSIPESQQRHFNRGPIEALMASLQRTVDLVGFTFKSIGRMLQGLISPSNLSGPITIAQVAASTAEAGWVSWLGFLALLSVSLGALNLLPIPVLDGGHLVFYGFEALMGRPLPERVQMAGYQLGVVLVLSIMAFALYNDFSKL